MYENSKSLESLLEIPGNLGFEIRRFEKSLNTISMISKSIQSIPVEVYKISESQEGI